MSKKLYVGNCAFELDESALETFIKDQGVEIDTVKIIRDRDTGRSRGFGFAELSPSGRIEDAVDALNGKEIQGRALTVSAARERTDSHNNSRHNRSNTRW